MWIFHEFMNFLLPHRSWIRNLKFIREDSIFDLFLYAYRMTSHSTSLKTWSIKLFNNKKFSGSWWCMIFILLIVVKGKLNLTDILRKLVIFFVLPIKLSTFSNNISLCKLRCERYFNWFPVVKTSLWVLNWRKQPRWEKQTKNIYAKKFFWCWIFSFFVYFLSFQRKS